MNVFGLRELTSPAELSIRNASVHLHGDSFATNRLRQSISSRLTGQRIYTGYTVNGGTLALQAQNLEENPIWWDRILVIMDGGLSDAYATAIASIEEMAVRMTSGRWLYVQGGLDSQRATGEALRDLFDQVNAYMAANHADNYVETKSYAQALAISDTGASGYANDQTDLASDIWPRSITYDGLHPQVEGSENTGLGQTVAGDVMLAQRIVAKINANGW